MNTAKIEQATVLLLVASEGHVILKAPRCVSPWRAKKITSNLPSTSTSHPDFPEESLFWLALYIYTENLEVTRAVLNGWMPPD